MSDIEQCAIADLISQVNELEKQLLEAKANQLQLAIENFHILKIEQQLLEARTRVARLENLSESHLASLEDAYNQLAVMPLGENETVIARQCKKDGLNALHEYVKATLIESPTQSLAIIQADAIEQAMPELATVDNCNYSDAFRIGWNTCLKEFSVLVDNLRNSVKDGES